MCDAFSSPSISEMIRRISSGVRDAGDARLVGRPHRVPVDAVHLLVEELIAQVGPRLLKRLDLLA